MRVGPLPFLRWKSMSARRRELWISQASRNWALNAPNVCWPAYALNLNPTAGIGRNRGIAL